MPEAISAPPAPTPAPTPTPAPSGGGTRPVGAEPSQFATLPPVAGKAQPIEAEATGMEASLERLRKLSRKDEPKPEKPQKPEKPEKPQTAPAAEDAAAKTQGETKPGQEKPAPPVKPESRAKPLREAYEALKAKHDALEKEFKTFQANPYEHPEVKPLVEENEQLRQQLAQYDDELLYVNEEKSEKWRQEHYRPYVQTYQDAYATLAEWQVPLENGAVRPLTPQEFQKIVATGSGREALEVARSIYGEDGIEPGVVFAARQHVLEASRRLQRARENIRQTARQRQQQALQQSRQEAQLWKQFNDQAVEKYPQWFKPREGDDKANELLKKGYDFADKAFSAEAQQWTPEQRARHHSALRNRAAAFDRVVYDLKGAQTRIKELEAELAEFQKSDPSRSDAAGGERKSEPTVLDRIRAYAR